MHKKLGEDQRGLVSLTVTIIIMIVITLVVSSFALIVRREQRRSLDRQLSSQAFYAAETGIEDAVSAITTKQFPTPIIPGDVTECSGSNSFTDLTQGAGVNFNSTISDNISYSCVLIDQTPDDWQISDANPSTGSFVVPVSTPSNMSKIRISWQQHDGETNFAPVSFPNLPQNNMNSPVLRVTIIPGFNGGSLSKAQLDDGTHTMFLYPEADGNVGNTGTISYRNGGAGWGPSNPQQGAIVSGRCNASNTSPFFCNVEITGLNAQEYFVHVQPLYESASINIKALDGGNNPLPQENSQAVIDATGKASDVLRRVQVRVPIGDGLRTRNLGGILPPGALVTEEEICKKWELSGGDAENLCTSTTIPLGTPIAGGAGNASIGHCSDPTDPLCAPHVGDPGAPQFRWKQSFGNESNNAPGVVLNCTWDWGDGTSDTYPASSSACTYLGRVSHDYNPPTDSKGWEALIISTNGAQGCWKFNVTLTMRFTPSSGLGNDQDTYTVYLPGGQANDPPNPTTGEGICYRSSTLYVP